MQNKMTIVIPAAGLGRRMKSYGPKALIELAPRQTLLGRQLQLLRQQFPTADIVVVVGFEAEKVLKVVPPGVRVVENEHYEVTNVARSIEMGLRSSSCDAALVVYGDLVFTESMFASLPLTQSFVVIDTASRFREFEVGCTVVDGHVTQFSYGLDTKWAQVVYLTGPELVQFRRLVAGRDKRKFFGYEILNELIDDGGILAAVEPPDMRIVEIDTSRDIDAAKKLL